MGLGGFTGAEGAHGSILGQHRAIRRGCTGLAFKLDVSSAARWRLYPDEVNGGVRVLMTGPIFKEAPPKFPLLRLPARIGLANS